MYAAADASRLSQLVVAIGATGLALAVLGLLRPWGWLVTGAIAAAGAAYAVELSLGPRTIDAWAPLVAAALFVAAELGFWSIEPCTARPERAVVVRRLVFLAASAFVVALVGSVLLYATTGASGGIGFESLGVTAAVVALAIIAFLARRSRESGSAPA
jgi:hypothetical protein